MIESVINVSHFTWKDNLLFYFFDTFLDKSRGCSWGVLAGFCDGD